MRSTCSHLCDRATNFSGLGGQARNTLERSRIFTFNLPFLILPNRLLVIHSNDAAGLSRARRDISLLTGELRLWPVGGCAGYSKSKIIRKLHPGAMLRLEAHAESEHDLVLALNRFSRRILGLRPR